MNSTGSPYMDLGIAFFVLFLMISPLIMRHAESKKADPKRHNPYDITNKIKLAVRFKYMDFNNYTAKIISNATLHLFDLFTAFAEAFKVIQETDQDARSIVYTEGVPEEALSDRDDHFWGTEDAIHVVGEMQDLLSEYAPNGYYFGTSPGDASCFGFWCIWDPVHTGSTHMIARSTGESDPSNEFYVVRLDDMMNEDHGIHLDPLKIEFVDFESLLEFYLSGLREGERFGILKGKDDQDRVYTRVCDKYEALLKLAVELLRERVVSIDPKAVKSVLDLNMGVTAHDLDNIVDLLGNSRMYSVEKNK